MVLLVTLSFYYHSECDSRYFHAIMPLANFDKWGPRSILFWSLLNVHGDVFPQGMQGYKPFNEESRMLNCWLKYTGARHTYIWSIYGCCVLLFSVFCYSRTDNHSSLFTISWVEESGSMSGAITVIITHPLWLAASCHCFLHHFIGTKKQWPKWGVYCHLLRWLGVIEMPIGLG